MIHSGKDYQLVNKNNSLWLVSQVCYLFHFMETNCSDC